MWFNCFRVISFLLQLEECASTLVCKLVLENKVQSLRVPEPAVLCGKVRAVAWEQFWNKDCNSWLLNRNDASDFFLFYSTCGLAEELEQEKKSSQPKSACGNVNSHFVCILWFAGCSLCLRTVFSDDCSLKQLLTAFKTLPASAQLLPLPSHLLERPLCSAPVCCVPTVRVPPSQEAE